MSRARARRVLLAALAGMAECSYTTIATAARHEQVIKKSRFVALAAPVQNSEEALQFVKSAADPKARHNCFAWRLADGSSRTNGDGEPGGTAGPPILAAIDGAGLQDVAVLVQRHRLDGGQKLGTGGLVRAYGGAAESCLEGAPKEEREPRALMSVRYDAADTGAVFALLAPFSPSVVDGGAAEATIEASFEAPPDEAERLAAALRAATAGRIDGVWVESPDEAFPLPRFVAG